MASFRRSGSKRNRHLVDVLSEVLFELLFQLLLLIRRDALIGQDVFAAPGKGSRSQLDFASHANADGLALTVADDGKSLCTRDAQGCAGLSGIPAQPVFAGPNADAILLIAS
jgi:hypothetical protein